MHKGRCDTRNKGQLYTKATTLYQVEMQRTIISCDLATVLSSKKEKKSPPQEHKVEGP